jgi:hypothetical protein
VNLQTAPPYELAVLFLVEDPNTEAVPLPVVHRLLDALPSGFLCKRFAVCGKALHYQWITIEAMDGGKLRWRNGLRDEAGRGQGGYGYGHILLQTKKGNRLK